MLRNFLYLNESDLDGYLSSLEDGLRGAVQQKDAKSSSIGGGIGMPHLSAKGDKNHQNEEMSSRTDTPSARFERLTQLARQTGDGSDWIEINNPDKQFSELTSGSLIEIGCEVYVPDAIKAISQIGGFNKTLSLIGNMKSIGTALNLDTTGLPSQEQIAAISSLSNIDSSTIDLMFVGECDGANLRVTGKLDGEYIKGEIEGTVKVVGKITTKWDEKRWKPLIILRGINTVSREQRRIQESTKPAIDQEQNWLEGPAIMLDVLAIYR